MTPKLSNDILEFLNLATTQEFLSAATVFTEILENKTITKDELIVQVHSALVDLYSTGQKLQEIELKYSSADSEIEEVFDDKNAVLIAELGDDNYYWEIFDPTYFEKNGVPEKEWTIADREATQGWLVDDFEDIYRDIKRELHKIKNIGNDEAIEEALWKLKFSFNNHWGVHAINAMRYLHYYRYANKF